MPPLTRENLKTYSRCDDISKITRLKAWAKDVDDVTIFNSYMSKPINIKVLNLSGNKISDVSPIAELTNIEELYLRKNKISDLDGLITCLNKLPKLTSLWIEDNKCVETSEKYTKLLKSLSANIKRINGKPREKIEEIYKSPSPVARVLTPEIENSPNDTKFLVDNQCRNPDSSKLEPASILVDNEDKNTATETTPSPSSSKSNSQPSHVLTASLALIQTLNKTELLTLQSSIAEILNRDSDNKLAVSEMI